MTDRVWATIPDKPLRAWGSALRMTDAGMAQIITPALIGPTAKPFRLGPCSVCGERRFWCEHTAPQSSKGDAS